VRGPSAFSRSTREVRLGDGSKFTRRGEKWFRKGCKPNSVCAPEGAERIICLSSQYPEPAALARGRRGPRHSSLFGLAPDGVFRAPTIAGRAVGSYPAFSPLPSSVAERRRFVFCGTIRPQRLASLRPACIPGPTARSYAASRPVEFGLSSSDPPRRAGSDSPPFRNQLQRKGQTGRSKDW